MGLPRAAVELAGLLHRVLDNMKPEEADAFMRHLKKGKGSLGTGMILLGFALVGGYRQKDDKRKPGDVGPEDVKVRFHVTGEARTQLFESPASPGLWKEMSPACREPRPARVRVENSKPRSYNCSSEQYYVCSCFLPARPFPCLCFGERSPVPDCA